MKQGNLSDLTGDEKRRFEDGMREWTKTVLGPSFEFVSFEYKGDDESNSWSIIAKERPDEEESHPILLRLPEYMRKACPSLAEDAQ